MAPNQFPIGPAILRPTVGARAGISTSSFHSLLAKTMSRRRNHPNEN